MSFWKWNFLDHYFSCDQCGRLKRQFRSFALLFAYAYGCGIITSCLAVIIGYPFYGDGVLAIIKIADIYGIIAFLGWAILFDSKIRCQCESPNYLTNIGPLEKKMEIRCNTQGARSIR